MNPLTDQDRNRIEQVIASTFGGLHHAPTIHWHAYYAEVNAALDCRLATFDGDYLARLVFSSHDWCVRVELDRSGPGLVKLRLHPRHTREGAMHARLPTLADAVASWRARHPVEDGL